MKKPHPMLHKEYIVKSTGQHLKVISVIGENARLKYLNRDSPEVHTTVQQIERVVKLTAWEEVG